MKKYLWIVALIAALSMVMSGCGGGDGPDGPGGDEDLVKKTVFDLAEAEGIQALPVGVIDNTGFAGTGNPISPLVRAGGDGDITYEIVENGGKKAIKFTTNATWGAGIDLPFGEFGFHEGDEVTVKGKVITKDKSVNMNAKPGDQEFIASFNGNGDFELKSTLTKAYITSIKGASPSAIRIDGREKGVVVQINSITIVGMRPSNLKTLSAPVITATATGVSWTAIDGAGGYKVFANSEEEPITTATAAATSANLADLVTLVNGTYSITVQATGISGVSKDSPISNTVMFTKSPPPEPSFTVAFNGTEQSAATKGTFVILEDKTGYTFTYPTSGENINYENSYVFFKVALGTDNLSDFSKIIVNIKGGTGDFNYKNAFIAASKTGFTGWLNVDDPAAITANTATGDIASAKDLNFTIDAAKATTAVGAEKGIYIAVIVPCDDKKDSVTTSYTISNIRFTK